MRVVAVLVALGMWAASVGPAHAWTKARIRSADAHVILQRDGRALVAMRLKLHIQRGWLDGLDITGLDPDLELDPDKRPWIVSLDGEDKFHPEAHVHGDGYVELDLDERPSPQHGDYRVGLVYTTRLVEDGARIGPDDQIRIQWAFPAWRWGLDRVDVAISAPSGTHAQAAGDTTYTASRTRTDAGTRTVFQWNRPHLPRTTRWPFQLRVPADQLAPQLRDTLESRASPPPTEEATLVRGLAPVATAVIVLAFALAIVALGRHHAFRRACARVRVRPRPLVPLRSTAARTVLVLMAAVVGACLWPIAPWGASVAFGMVVALGLQRTPAFPSPPRPGTWRPASSYYNGSASRMRAALDPCRLPGAVLLSAVAAAVVTGVWYHAGTGPAASGATALHGAAWLVPLTLTGLSHQLPARAPRRLRQLRIAARRMRASLAPMNEQPVSVALEPVVHVDTDGRWQDARLRLHTSIAPGGLVHVDLALADRRHPGGYVGMPVLLALCRPDSPADRSLTCAWPGATRVSGPAGRVAYYLTLDGVSLPRIETHLAALRAAAEGAHTAATQALPEPDAFDPDALPAHARLENRVDAL